MPVIGQGTWAMEHRRSEAIAGRRDEVFLVTKVMPSNASYPGTLEACERSLRRLRTDRLDVYLLHAPSRHPFEETARAFHRLVEEGRIASLGVSNFDPDRIDAAAAVAGPRSIACNQVCYHLRPRWIEHELIDRCAGHRISVVGYSPFGEGNFPGGHPVLRSVAAAHGATPHQVALRFLVRRPELFTIPKSSSTAHVEENAGAGDHVLSDEELAAIDTAFPIESPSRGLPRL